jgi:hypothetical protein
VTTPLKIEYRRPWLYPKQRAAIFDCCDVFGSPARYSLIEASTKAGKTVGCMAWLFEQALAGKEGDNFWWIAPIYAQAKIAFRRLKRGLPKSLFKANETELTITLLHGPVIWFKSAEKPDALYGDDVKAGVIDEASRVREDSFFAIRSTLTATRGKLRIIGNVKGRKNWFYRMCRKAQAGSKDMAYAKLTAYDAVDGGVIDKAEIEDAKEQLPENVFRELYLAEASDDEGNPFGIKHIAAITVKGMPSDSPAVACGVDLAKSVDWSVVIGMDKLARVCGFERWQHVPWDTTEKRILELCGKTPSLVDSTGVGDPIVERLQAKRRNVFEGFQISAPSKQRLMEGLAVAIQSHSIQIPDGPIRAELDNFEYVYTRTGVKYSAPEGYHDDCVIALALAVEKYRHVAVRFDLHGSPLGGTRVSPWLGGIGDSNG